MKLFFTKTPQDTLKQIFREKGIDEIKILNGNFLVSVVDTAEDNHAIKNHDLMYSL